MEMNLFRKYRNRIRGLCDSIQDCGKYFITCTTSYDLGMHELVTHELATHSIAVVMLDKMTKLICCGILRNTDSEAKAAEIMYELEKYAMQSLHEEIA